MCTSQDILSYAKYIHFSEYPLIVWTKGEKRMELQQLKNMTMIEPHVALSDVRPAPTPQAHFRVEGGAPGLEGTVSAAQ